MEMRIGKGGRRWENYYFALGVPQYSEVRKNTGNIKTALLEPVNLFTNDGEVGNVLAFYENCPWRLPIESVVNIYKMDGNYWSIGGNNGSVNRRVGKRLNVNLYNKILPEKWNPLAAKRAIQLVEKSNNGTIPTAEKFLAGKIGIESFWDTIEFAATSPSGKDITVGFAGQAHRSELAVRRLEDHGFDTSASVFKSYHK